MTGKPAKLAFFLVVILITFPSLAEADGIEDKVLENPAGVNELIVNVVQHGTVWVDGNPTGIMINLTTPQDDHRQDVDIGVNRAKDELGVDVLVIEEDNPENPFSYNISGIVKSRANHLTSLPSSYVIPENVEVYLQATENIQSSDPRFRNLAEEITGDSRDDFEKVAKLAFWVYDQMTYDLSYSDRTLDAVTVLDNKAGVCAEYTTLFIALSRSIGIPTKYVSAYAYGEYGWERHAYAEVYLGKWVPVDPLWLEIGYMDATHIRFGDHADNRVRNKVEVSGYNLKGSPEWLEDEIDLSTVSYSQVEKEEDYGLAISSESFRKGDDGVVTLSITPKEFIVGKIILETCSGEYDIADVEDKEKRVLLRPGEKEQVSWKIDINTDLPEDYIFNCPLTLNSRSLALKTINATVNTQYGEREKGKISAKLSSEVLELGDEQTVYLRVEDLGRGSWIGIIAGKEHEKYQLETGNLVTSFTFTPEKLGEGEVIAYTSEGEVVNLGYTVERTLSLAIEDFSVPEHLKIGESKNISARVVNKGKSGESVHLNLKVEGEDNFANFLLKDTYAVSLPVSFRSPGMKTIKLEVSGAGTDLSETRVIEVYQEPVIYYDTVYEDGKGTLRLEVKNSRIKNVTILIGETRKEIGEISGEKEIEFSLAPGEYAMTIECSDIGGKPYEISETVEFREKNILEMILDAINGFIEWIMGFFSP